MKKVQEGDFVTVHYTGKLSGGEVFDTSRGREPLEVQVLSLIHISEPTRPY